MPILAALFDRVGRHEQAATNRPQRSVDSLELPWRGAYPQIDATIAHLCEVLGDQTYESLARKDEAMTTAGMVTYAYDQIDQARAELKGVSK
jgi:hypothetical protein